MVVEGVVQDRRRRHRGHWRTTSRMMLGTWMERVPYHHSQRAGRACSTSLEVVEVGLWARVRPSEEGEGELEEERVRTRPVAC